MKAAINFLGLPTAALFFTISMIVPAQAQGTLQTWVSATGDNNNPCLRTLPCLTFSTALSKVAAGGEIDCLDPGPFGSVTINKAVTIDCGSGETGAVGETTGIIVQAGVNDVVQIRKLVVNGFSSAAAPTSSGIQYLSGKSLHIDDVNIMNANINGIDVAPTGNAMLDVVNTNIMNCTNNGIGIAVGGAGLVSVSLKGVRMSQGFHGLRVADNASTTIHVSIEDSIASNNSSSGFIATTGGGRLTMLLEHSSSVNNGANGVVADGSNAELHLSNAHIFGNSTGVAATNGASLISYKNNEIKLNGSNGSPTGVVGFD